MATDKSYWSQDRLYKNELFKSILTRDRFASIMWFLKFWWGTRRWPFRKDQVPQKPLKCYCSRNFHASSEFIVRWIDDIAACEVGLPSIHEKEKTQVWDQIFGTVYQRWFCNENRNLLRSKISSPLVLWASRSYGSSFNGALPFISW